MGFRRGGHRDQLFFMVGQVWPISWTLKY
jgi:hypothetical protein